MEYKCPLYESSQFTCDRPAVHLVNGTAICAYHALRIAATPVPPQEEYIPGYCQGCVRIEMDKLDYSQVFPAFKVVASDHCDGCTEDESFAECPNNCADWKGTPGESCSCECHT